MRRICLSRVCIRLTSCAFLFLVACTNTVDGWFLHPNTINLRQPEADRLLFRSRSMDTKTPITKHHKSSSFTSIFSTSDDDDHLDEKQKNETSASTSDNKDARSATDPYKTRLSSDEQLSLNSLDGANKRDKSTGMRQSGYDLGLGKNLPVGNDSNSEDHEKTKINKDVKTQLHWYAPDPVQKIDTPQQNFKPVSRSSYNGPPSDTSERGQRKRKMVARRQEDQFLRGALWHEEHYGDKDTVKTETPSDTPVSEMSKSDSEGPKKPALFYPDINLSIPSSIYSEENDVIWDLMRYEAYQEAQREPLLVSFLYSSILNHDSLESSLAFLLANKLSSPAMISTQVQSLVLEALQKEPSVGRSLRADIMAVRDRDPACTCLPDVFLYFKGFHALQTYRVANVLWKVGKRVLAHYLQSQTSQIFQIDIHPNATLGSGIMLDHGTGIVIGETATVGHNCSVLHHVTLGGSGKKGVDRHPKVGEGVLLGAGASVLGNVKIGDGCQVGAGTLVITDLPPHCVAVGVPAKIIGSFVDVTEQPSNVMNQMMDTGFNPFQSAGI